jgi:hypothetical protein
MPESSRFHRCRRIPMDNERKRNGMESASGSPVWLEWVGSPAFQRVVRIGVPAAYVVVLAVLGLTLHHSGDGETESDFFSGFGPQARAILSGEMTADPYRGPVYPMFVALFHLILRNFGCNIFQSAILLSVLASGLALYFAQRLTERLFSRGVSYGVLVLLMASPVFVRYSYTAGTDMLFTAMVLASLYAFFRTERGTWRSVVGLGVLLGVMYLTRYNAVAIVGGVLIGIVLFNLWNLSWSKRLFAALAVAAVVFVVFLPYGIFTSARYDAFFYNKNYLNVAYGMYTVGARTNEFMAEHGDQLNGLWDVVMFDPARFAANAWKHLAIHLEMTMRGVILRPASVLMILGVLVWWLRRPTRRQWSYYVIGLVYMMLMALVFFAQRFYLPVLPLFFAIGINGISVASARYLGKRFASGVTAAVMIVVVAFSAISCFRYNQLFIHGSLRELCEVGRLVAESVPPELREGRRVAARKPHFGFWAGMETVPLPLVSSYEELLQTLHERKVDYLYFSYIAARMHGAVANLIDPTSSHKGLTAIYYSPVGVLYAVDPR